MREKNNLTLRHVYAVSGICLTVGALLIPALAADPERDKTRSISRFKSAALATLAYATDHDGTLPLQAGTDPMAGMRVMLLHKVAAGWLADGVGDKPERLHVDRQIWANSVLPYFSKRDGKMPWSMPGLPVVQFKKFDRKEVSRSIVRHHVGLAFNGLLHAWSVSAVAESAKTPIYSGMNFRQNLNGYATSNPMLQCNRPAEVCKFNPSGSPSKTSSSSENTDTWIALGMAKGFTVWIYDKGMTFGAVDGSAYWRSMAEIPRWPGHAFNVNEVPWSSLDGKSETGTPFWLTRCAEPGRTFQRGGIAYAGYFRPDSLFKWKPEECERF
jgi:hypothetical protein